MATGPTSKPPIGFVGLGIMGQPMARNALKAGFPVTATNRTLARAELLAADGATVVKTPREVAERSEIVVTMVTNAPEVEAVTFGPDSIVEGTHDGLLVIDMSSISPVASRAFAERAEEKGFRTLDAPSRAASSARSKRASRSWSAAKRPTSSARDRCSKRSGRRSCTSADMARGRPASSRIRSPSR